MSKTTGDDDDLNNEERISGRQEVYTQRDRDLLARLISEHDVHHVLFAAKRDAGTNAAKAK